MGEQKVEGPAIISDQKGSYEEMNPHFFTAPFYFAFIFFSCSWAAYSLSAYVFAKCMHNWYTAKDGISY